MDSPIKSYPVPERTVGQILEDKAKRNQEKVFLFYEDQQITYQQTNERANIASNSFLSLGLKKNDKVAMVMENCPEFLYAWFGLAKIGAWTIPINVALKGEGLAYIIQHCDAETIVVSLPFFENINFIRKDLKNIKRIIVHVPSPGHDLETRGEIILWPDFFQGSNHSPDIEVKHDDWMMIVYTAGTTGLPKGVLKAQSYSYTSGLSVASFTRATPDDRFLTTLPLFHINGQNATTWAAIAADASTVLAKRFSARRFWDDIRRYHVTITSFLGAMIPILLKQPEKTNDSENPLRIGISAGTPAAGWEIFQERFQVKILELYGSSEGGALRNSDGKVGSMGKAIPVNLARVVDENDQELPPYQVGELVFKFVDPNLQLPQYYKMPEATAEKTRGGWLRTGDYAYKDEEGYFYFVDRKKDAIRRRGENISTYEVEKVINAHPHVLESAAVGVPAEMGEDEVKICVVLKPGHKLTPAELIAYCEPRMAYFMVPRYVEFLDVLPKTTTQKVMKSNLKEMGVNKNTWDREKAGYQVKKYKE
ncbi:MAG: ATP-dependent acyl-CoA ligase [Deltaproteobacteria bacterium]|nr:ATP-dependent acyl-CoA ligase [Deltaproteobacteria bacterium]